MPDLPPFSLDEKLGKPHQPLRLETPPGYRDYWRQVIRTAPPAPTTGWLLVPIELLAVVEVELDRDFGPGIRFYQLGYLTRYEEAERIVMLDEVVRRREP